ncbi:uncharacterized protein LOC112053506 [Bicyclus anynana]|uniref:Uncharacterized protein LOC112053506 n=1 Tax=Bicyclus anynana TaxID=110368 RepID=A0A6J1NLS4_BICAN|nr:uncharacterized protein LOC112053506 [Bicyclus anynana]
MWGLLVLLVAGAHALRPDDADIPPYVQARAAFTHSRLYLQESAPQESKDITSPLSRRHVAFGILVAVTGTIAEKYEEDGKDKYLDIMDEQVPYAWQNYETVARNVNQILAEANAKIQPITSLIDAICRNLDIEKCNIQVNERITNSDAFTKHRAKLLIALGRVSQILTKHEDELNQVSKTFKVVPYLLQNFQTMSYNQFIKELHNVYVMLRKSRLRH